MAGRVPEGQFVAPYVFERVEGDVRAEGLEHHALRLERANGSTAPNRPGEGDRVGADVGPDLHDRVAAAAYLREESHLPLAVFSVDADGPSDVDVVRVVQEVSVPRLYNAVVPLTSDEVL